MKFQGPLICHHAGSGLPPTQYRVQPLFGVAGPCPPMLNLSALPAGDRRATWERIKAERPAQAALIGSDEVRALREAFDCDVLVEVFADE